MATAVEGSSFESTSSVYGMPASLEAVLAAKAAVQGAATCTSSSVDEGGEVSVAKTPKRVSVKAPSPPSTRSSSASSSTSDTYKNSHVLHPPPPPTATPQTTTTPAAKELPSRSKGSPSRTNVVTPIVVKHVAKFESVSDEEEEADLGSRLAASRRSLGRLDWNEEERRRRRNTLKLELEAGEANGKSIASPKTKISTTFKKISPDDRTALNILDGASPSKTKRFRPKTRRSPRNRNSALGTPSANAVVPPSVVVVPTTAVTKPSASLVVQPQLLSPSASPQKKQLSGRGAKPSTELRLKALSTESLRSVSPGSDSVFYSEVDLTQEHQVSPCPFCAACQPLLSNVPLKVQCHNCGKEVDIVAAHPEDQATDQSEADRPEIVQPPAGFADSPNGLPKPRLYKKLDRRHRNEDRSGGERRHHRNRSESRAKSEERGDSQPGGVFPKAIRPAGSSPCVAVEDPPLGDKFSQQAADPDQGIYHGVYRLGVWICIANQDVFRRSEGGGGECFSKLL